MKTDKLVFISLSNRMGGTEQCLQMLAEASAGKQIFLQKSNTNCLIFEKDVEPVFLTEGSLFYGFILLIKELFKYRKGYVIISSASYLNGYLGFLKRIGYLKSLVIVRESTSIFTRFKGIKRATYNLVYKLGYPSVNHVVCQTEKMRSQFLEHNKFFTENKVTTVANPVNLKSIYTKATEAVDTGTGEFICAAGRLIPIKGFSILIKAFKDIADEHLNLNLIILGEGPERLKLTELIKELNLEHRVFLKGHVDNPFPYFKQAKVCVVSSIEEGFPNVLLQMIALNSAVVSTLCAGGIEDIPGIIKVSPGNITALADGIKQMLPHDALGKREMLDDYLSDRSPEAFLNKIQMFK